MNGDPPVPVPPIRRWWPAIVASSLLLLGLTSAAGRAAADSVPAAAGEFVPLSSTALVDTTGGVGLTGPLQAGATRPVTVTGAAGVPSTGVLAVMLHISTSDSASPGINSNGNVWAWPAEARGPLRGRREPARRSRWPTTPRSSRWVSAGQISFYNGPTVRRSTSRPMSRATSPRATRPRARCSRH